MRTTILVVPVLFVAVAALYAATAYEQYDPYTRRYTVTFDYVRGLKVGNQVWARGFEVGRVEAVTLVDDTEILKAAKENPGEEKERVIVTLKTVPELMLPKDATEVSVEPLNPFGAVYVEIVTTKPAVDAETYGAQEPIEGVESETSPFVDALRRRDPRITEGLGDIRRGFEEFKDSDSFLARALYQPGAAYELDEAISNYDDALADFARSMKALEDGEGGLGSVLADDPEAVEDLKVTLEDLAQSFADISGSLQESNRGEGQVGRWVYDKDGGYETRELVGDLTQTAQDFNGDGGLGKSLSDPEAYRGLRESTAELAEGLSSVRREDGLGGLVNDPAAGKELKNSLASLSDALREAASDEGIIGDADGAEALRDTMNELKELTSDLDEAIRRSVASQPVNTIHGAVFSIF